MSATELSAPNSAEYRRPKHGVGMLKPWKPGQTGNAGGIPQKYTEAKAALRNWCCEDGVDRLIELANSRDERVAAIIVQGIWDRAFGKPKEYDPNEDAPRTVIDLSRLTGAQLAIIRTMIDSGAIRPAEEEAAPVVDTPAEEPK